MMRFLQCCVYSLDCMIYFRAKSDNEKLRKILSVLLIPAGLIRYLWVSLVACCLGEKDKKKKCAVVMIIKNEAQYIQEFIEYYTLLGCDLIIYDNDSDDGSAEIIKAFKNVRYIPWSGKKRQVDAYNQACKKYKSEYKYMMFFDADEFQQPDEMMEGKSLREVLDRVFFDKKKVACLGINWLVFGSSGLIEDPTEGVVDSFTQCAKDDFEWNQLVKSCVCPDKIVGWVDPHLPLQAAGYKKINLDGKAIVAPRNEMPTRRDIRLYHYFVKNKKHFAEKVEKGMADRNAKRTMDEFYYYDKNDVYNDKAIKMKEYLKTKKR